MPTNIYSSLSISFFNFVPVIAYVSIKERMHGSACSYHTFFPRCNGMDIGIRYPLFGICCKEHHGNSWFPHKTE